MAERSYAQLPISTSQTGKKTLSARRGIFPSSEKWIHAIPSIIFFSFFILWWFSHPVTVETRNGRIITVYQFKKSPNISPTRNETRVEIAILASSAASPTALYFSGNQNLTLHNATELAKAKLEPTISKT